MIFRRNRAARPEPVPASPRYRVEWVPLSLTELQAYARVLLGAEQAMVRRRHDLANLCHATEQIGALYQRLGAASVSVPDPATICLPVQKSEIHDLERAVKDLDFYSGPADLAREGRNLLWLLQARLGRERAVVHAGGTPMFDGPTPRAVVVDDQAVPVDFTELPPAPRRG